MKDAEKLWHAVFEAGAEFGIKPAGLGSRDTLRLKQVSACTDTKLTMIILYRGWFGLDHEIRAGNDFINRAYHEK